MATRYIYYKRKSPRGTVTVERMWWLAVGLLIIFIAVQFGLAVANRSHAFWDWIVVGF